MLDHYPLGLLPFSALIRRGESSGAGPATAVPGVLY